MSSLTQAKPHPSDEYIKDPDTDLEVYIPEHVHLPQSDKYCSIWINPTEVYDDELNSLALREDLADGHILASYFRLDDKASLQTDLERELRNPSFLSQFRFAPDRRRGHGRQLLKDDWFNSVGLWRSDERSSRLLCRPNLSLSHFFTLDPVGYWRDEEGESGPLTSLLSALSLLKGYENLTMEPEFVEWDFTMTEGREEAAIWVKTVGAKSSKVQRGYKSERMSLDLPNAVWRLRIDKESVAGMNGMNLDEDLQKQVESDTGYANGALTFKVHWDPNLKESGSEATPIPHGPREVRLRSLVPISRYEDDSD